MLAVAAIPSISGALVTARSELRKVLFLAPSFCGFRLCMKYLGTRCADLPVTHMEDVYGPSLG